MQLDQLSNADISFTMTTSHRDDESDSETSSLLGPIDEQQGLINHEGHLFDGGSINSDRLVPSPPDRFKLVYMIFYLIGIGTLLPWNMFITAKDYFSYQLRNTSYPADDYENPNGQTDLQLSYESSVALASMFPNVIMQFANSALSGRVSMKKRLIGSMVLMLILFIITLVFTELNVESWQSTFFIVTIVCVVLISASSSLLTSSLFGLVVRFPQSYTQAIMSGMGLGGVFAAVANIITLAIGGTVQDSAFWYFLLAIIVVVLALVSYLMLYKLEYAQHHHKLYKEILLKSMTQKRKSFLREFVDIMKVIWRYSLSIILVFSVTLALFPATTSNVQSINKDNGSQWTGKYFLALYCFLLFNVGDYVGRTVAAWIRIPKPSILLPILSLLRIVFVPLFAMCNAQPRNTLPVWFNSDVWPIVIMSVFAVTNGYLSTQALMIAPSLVSKQQAELAGLLMSTSMTIGLALGSGLSYAVVIAVKNL